jgi:hypothetical protein
VGGIVGWYSSIIVISHSVIFSDYDQFDFHASSVKFFTIVRSFRRRRIDFLKISDDGLRYAFDPSCGVHRGHRGAKREGSRRNETLLDGLAARCVRGGRAGSGVLGSVGGGGATRDSRGDQGVTTVTVNTTWDDSRLISKGIPIVGWAVTTFQAYRAWGKCR